MTHNGIVPNPNFRENPARALYLDGEIETELLLKLTREYHRLRSESLDPITLYISSPGGSVEVFEWMKDLLWTPDQNGERPIIITVANGMAASAAARLLVFGDYSISYPSSLIYCHGTRLPKVDEVTREKADAISSRMEDSNRATADEFVEKIISNLAFLLDSNRTQVEEIQKRQSSNLINALAAFIHSRLGPSGKEIILAVFEDLNETDSLAAFLSTSENSKLLKDAQAVGRTEYEKILLKLIIDFLFTTGWNDADRLTDAFSHDLRRLFKSRRTYFNSLGSSMENALSVLPFLLTTQEIEEFVTAQEQDDEEYINTKIVLLLVPLWQLATSISNRLVKGENPLSALDSYWLGLVQEVLGSELPCARHIAEIQDCEDEPIEDPLSILPD